MKLHIRIPKISDFFVVVSKDNPSKPQIIKVDKENPPSALDEKQMETNLERINMWIGNCDQKASFLLAFLGVAATIFITSDVIGTIKELIVLPFLSYFKDGIGSFDLLRFCFAVCLIVGLVCIFISLISLLLSLMAKTDYTKFQQPGMESRSLLFYKHIASMGYPEFSLAKNDRYNDLRSQTYTNACICTAKFAHYNRGLVLVLLALPFLVTAFGLYLFV